MTVWKKNCFVLSGIYLYKAYLFSSSCWFSLPKEMISYSEFHEQYILLRKFLRHNIKVVWTPWRHKFSNKRHGRSLSRNVNSFPMPNLLPPNGASTGPMKTLISLLTTDGNIFLSLENTGNNAGNGLRQNSDFTAFYCLCIEQISVNKAS